MAKIALLFSGLPRQWSTCVGSQLGLFRQHAADVFFHFWDTVDREEKRRIVETYRPKAHLFEPPIDFSSWEAQFTNLDLINSPARVLSMYYSWKQVAALFEDYREETGIRYDYLVRLRSDLMFFDAIDNLLTEVGPNDLLVSNHNDFNLINDMFALGHEAPVLYYLSIYDHVLAYKDQIIFNPELLLLHHLRCDDSEVNLVRKRLTMLVFRPDMVGLPLEECLKQHPGLNKWRDPEIVAAHEDYHGRRLGDEGRRYVADFKRRQLRKLDRRQGRNKPGGSAPAN